MFRWRIARVQAENFQCWRKLDWNLKDLPNIVLIQGNRGPKRSNGSGKSSLLEAICWCLYKKLARKSGKARCRFADDKADCWVRCTLEITGPDGKPFTVVAERGESSFRFTGDGEQSTSAGPQDRLESYLGDFLTFSTTTMFTGEISSFCRMTDAPRKELLEKMLDHARFSAAQARAKERKDSAIAAISTLEGRLPVYQANIDGIRSRRQADTFACFQRNARIVREHRRRRETVWRLSDEANRAFDLMVAERKRVQGEEDAARSKAADAESRVVELSTKYDAAVKSQAELQARFDEKRRAISTIEQEIVEMSEGKHPDICPTCSQRWPHDRDPAEVEQAATVKRGKIQAIRKEMEAVRSDLMTVQETVRELAGQRSDARRDAQAAMQAVNSGKLRTLMADALQAEATLVVEQQRFVEWCAETDLFEQSDALAALDDELDRNRAAIAEVAEKVSDFKDQERRLAFWVKGFGKSGLPSFLVDSAIPAMNQTVGEVASDLSDGELSVSFDPDAARGSQSVFAVKVDYRDGGDGYNEVSNGEKSRIDVAVLFAIRELAASRGKAECMQIFLDEVIDGADEHFAEAFLRMVRTRYADRQVFLISHDPAVISLCDKSITVHKRGSAASLSIG